jgi:hypothetical protein
MIAWAGANLGSPACAWYDCHPAYLCFSLGKLSSTAPKMDEGVLRHDIRLQGEAETVFFAI